jgi:hypothetical protein
MINNSDAINPVASTNELKIAVFLASKTTVMYEFLSCVGFQKAHVSKSPFKTINVKLKEKDIEKLKHFNSK